MLTALRAGAALVVVLYHLWPVLLPSHPLPWPGPEAVIVFFVISGYLISAVTEGREATPGVFLHSRATRILSVSVPALALAAAVALLVPRPTPHYVAPMDGPGQVAAHTLLNLLFLGQLWFAEWAAPANGPYWSLNYECWYYAVFAAWRFGGRRRWPLAGALAAVAGPKILLLMPCWLLGVTLHRWGGRVRLGPAAANTLLLAAAAAAILLLHLDAPKLIRAALVGEGEGLPQLANANKFAGHFLLAVCVAALLLAASRLAWVGWVLAPTLPALRWVSDRTFSIYLYHTPVFILAWDGLGLRGWAAVGVTAAGVLVLAQGTERQLPRLRRLAQRLWMAPQQEQPSGIC